MKNNTIYNYTEKYQVYESMEMHINNQIYKSLSRKIQWNVPHRTTQQTTKERHKPRELHKHLGDQDIRHYEDFNSSMTYRLNI